MRKPAWVNFTGALLRWAYSTATKKDPFSFMEYVKGFAGSETREENRSINGSVMLFVFLFIGYLAIVIACANG